MKIYRIDTICQDMDYCFVSGTGNINEYDLTRGQHWESAPADFTESQLRIEEDDGGLELTDLIGSTNQLLMIRYDIILSLSERLKCEPIEFHKFRLLDARGRVHSDDYAIVNPLDPVSCLSIEASEVTIDESDGGIEWIERYVLEKEKVPDRDIFRIAEDVYEFFVTQNFIDAVAVSGYSNFTFKEIKTV